MLKCFCHIRLGEWLGGGGVAGWLAGRVGIGREKLLNYLWCLPTIDVVALRTGWVQWPWIGPLGGIGPLGWVHKLGLVVHKAW